MLRFTLLAVLAFGCKTPTTGPGPGPEPTPNTGNGSTGSFGSGSGSATTTPPPATVTECEQKRCGPQLGMKSTACSDGSIGGPTGRCIEHADKTCGWEIRSCP